MTIVTDTMTESPAIRYSPMKFLNFARLNYEEERTKSFRSWPVHYPIDPGRLAKAGFYSTGREDEVVCFSCQGTVKNWSYGDIVLKKHADLYPECDFIKNQSNNVPLVSKPKEPFIFENADKLNSNNSELSPLEFYNLKKSEKERLKTFCDKWRVSFINISDLAHAGFFYTGIGDTVQCPGCKGKISCWEQDSLPLREHLMHFPWCDYLLRDILKIRSEPSWFERPSYDICGNNKPPELYISTVDYNTFDDLGIDIHKGPVYPDLASFVARLRSFDSWPTDAPVSKGELAAAGFFYIGINDRTTCFYCNGGLCSWEKGDDPWVEHARWFSSCNFLRLTKGREFVKSCLIKHSSAAPEESISQQSSGNESLELLFKKVKEAMKSELVNYVVKCQIYPPYIVRAVVLIQIKITGHFFTNPEHFHRAVSFLFDEVEKKTAFDMRHLANENLCERLSNSCAISNASGTADDISPISQSSSNSDRSKKSGEDGITEKNNSVEDNASMDHDTASMDHDTASMDHDNTSKYHDDASKDHYLCKICMENEIGVAFLPCGHLHACTVCAPALKVCPMCRKDIQATVRVYID